MEGLKVVTAAEMARVERLSIQDGCDEIAYMEKAGIGIADFVRQNYKQKSCTLLVGKGNNGGDAFVCGCHLMDAGCAVRAITLFPAQECSDLCQKQWDRFEKQGGVISSEWVLEGVVVDGLLGTGFKGETEGQLKELIAAVNKTECPIVSIDIPSGVDGSTGDSAKEVIKADQTVYLGLPKAGFFLKKGWEFVGKLAGVDFGLSANYVDQAMATGYLFDERRAPDLLPKIERTRHKYQAGYVVAFAGAPGMPGAAQLASLAALRSGAGIVRLYHPAGMEDEFGSGVKELVRSPWNADRMGEILEEIKRAKALLLGPGIGEEESALKAILQLLATKKPAVVDADGLAVFQNVVDCGPEVVLTPHAGEMARLIDDVNPASCQEFAEKKGVTLVLKGAPTWIFHPGSKPIIVPRGDPGMAKAGTGDVLTGIIAAFLAQGLRGREAAVLGVYVHALAGEKVSYRLTSYSLIASDIIKEIPKVLKKLVG